MDKYPIVGIGGDDVHVTSNKGEDLAGNGTRVLDDEVTSAREIGNMVDD